MDKILIDDLETALRNKHNGINEYLNSLGKLWVTPYGVFSTLKQVESATGLFRSTIISKVKSKRASLQNWYVIDGNSELSAAEDCEFCDELDDSLFYENCWLCCVEHTHNTPLKEGNKIKYLYKGNEYETTYGDWIKGYRKHLELGEKFND